MQYLLVASRLSSSFRPMSATRHGFYSLEIVRTRAPPRRARPCTKAPPAPKRHRSLGVDDPPAGSKRGAFPGGCGLKQDAGRTTNLSHPARTSPWPPSREGPPPRTPPRLDAQQERGGRPGEDAEKEDRRPQKEGENEGADRGAYRMKHSLPRFYPGPHKEASGLASIFGRRLRSHNIWRSSRPPAPQLDQLRANHPKQVTYS